jgi:plastocyanin
MSFRSLRWAVLMAPLVAAPAAAQSLMYRSPNLAGTWVPDPWVVQFDFIHRFYVAPAPSHAVVNFPTFTLATGLGSGLAVGAWFGTKSMAGLGRGAISTNETEVFARWRFWGGAEGTDGFHVAITPAYDFLAQSVDGEVSADYARGPLTLEGAARILSKPLGSSSGARASFGGGAVVRVTRYIALSADVGSFVSPSVRAAWSAGVNFLIPGSPHTFSIEVSSAQTSSIQGNSIGNTFKPLYGFEFTIPLHLNRFRPWFHGDEARQIPLHMIPSVEGAAAAEVKMQALHYHSDTLTIAVGQVVRWTNTDPVEHTVAFDDGSGTSANIPQNGSFAHRFDAPGRYPYHCTQHPYMKGVVVVK